MYEVIGVTRVEESTSMWSVDYRVPNGDKQSVSLMAATREQAEGRAIKIISRLNYEYIGLKSSATAFGKNWNNRSLK